jgi:hypothetical protein
MNSGFVSAPSAIGAQGADALQSVDEGGQEVGGRTPRCTVRGTDTPGTTRYISNLTCTYTCSRMPSRTGGGASTDRTRAGHPGTPEPPGLAAVAPTRRRYEPDRPYPAPAAGILVPWAAACGCGRGTRRFIPWWRSASAACRCVPPRCPSPVAARTAAASPAASPSASSRRGVRVADGQEYRAPDLLSPHVDRGLVPQALPRRPTPGRLVRLPALGAVRNHDGAAQSCRRPG